MPVILTTPAECDRWLEADTTDALACNGRCPMSATDRCEGREGRQKPQGRAVIRIAITPAAFDAIERMTLGTVAAEPQVNEKGERLIWLAPRWVNKLNSTRRPSESYSEAIIRLATLWEGHWTHKRR
jgi:hypothetical protein